MKRMFTCCWITSATSVIWALTRPAEPEQAQRTARKNAQGHPDLTYPSQLRASKLYPLGKKNVRVIHSGYPSILL